MEYSNPELPEGINASQEHPLKEFFWLTASVMAAGLALILLAILLADMMSAHIPFHIERDFTARHIATEPDSPDMDAYLNALAERIARAEGLPEDMSVRIHFRAADTVNAFATLGGNIFMFRGLLEKLPHENALAMVLAHEIAHVKHRDPIRGAGRAVVLGLLLSVVSGDAGNVVLDRALSQGTTLTLLKYSREQERAADDEAISALMALYGHVAGADTLFEVLEAEHGGGSPPEFFSSHPLTAERIAKVRDAGAGHAAASELQALPAGFATWLNAAADGAAPAGP